MYAPEPTADAWHIEGAVNLKGGFTLGREIRITLTLDEEVVLANVGSNKIVVAGKEFLLTGANDAVTGMPMSNIGADGRQPFTA
jgi:hypothetical protein